ncbi:MAG: acetolactate synthase small subunit [Bacteroidales bacterium]|nr:acetolactate synthase small subunit [Bacteroidales bacterium]
MEKILYTITVYTENFVGLLNQITIIFTRRQINIESLTVSKSSIPGIHKFTITAETDLEMVKKVVKQIEKRIDVLKAFYHTDDDVIYQEVALYKIGAEALLDNPEIESIVRKYNARILEVNRSYGVLELSGHTEETQELFERLKEFHVLQFVRSGRIAITKSTVERLSDFLAEMEARNPDR